MGDHKREQSLQVYSSRTRPERLCAINKRVTLTFSPSFAFTAPEPQGLLVYRVVHSFNKSAVILSAVCRVFCGKRSRRICGFTAGFCNELLTQDTSPALQRGENAPKRTISPVGAAQIRRNSSRIRVHAMTLPRRCAGVDTVTPYQPLREAAMTHPHTSQKPATAHVTVKHLPSPPRSREFPPIEERILVPPMPLSASSRAGCPRSTHPQRRADHKPQ